MPRQYELILVPTTVEAIQISPDSVHRAALWCGGLEVEEIDALDDTKRSVALNVPTLDGIKRAQEGDYVVKDSDGTFTVIKQNLFEKTHRFLAG